MSPLVANDSRGEGGASSPAVKRWILGEPLHTEQLDSQLLPKRRALPIFASDALSSVAYAPQELLMILLTGGLAFLAFSPAVAAAVVVLLIVVVVSYRQLIKAYPSGGGDYEVASKILGEPAAVVAAALDGHDAVARRSLARFCSILGSVAGDAALIHGARTVMIAGGIIPRFIPFLRSSAFRERFLSKGRFAAYLESVSVQVVTHPHPGLLGAAVALRRPDAAETV